MRKPPDFSGDDGRSVSVLRLSIPAQVAWVLIGAIVFGAVWTSWQLWDVKQAIKDGTGDRWTKSFQREWAHRLKDDNRDNDSGRLNVPDVDSVAKGLE